MENTQKRLGKLRPPRVQITYDVETNGANVLKELPYVIGIMADLSGNNSTKLPLKRRKFIDLSLSNLDVAIGYLGTSIKITIPKFQLDEMIELVIDFDNVHDFTPDNLLNKIDFLKASTRRLRLLKDLKTKLECNEISRKLIKDFLQNSELMSYAQSWKSGSEVENKNMEDYLYKSELAFIDSQKTFAMDMLCELSKIGNVNTEQNVITCLDKEIVNIQEQLSWYLNAILHNKDFQRIEGSWTAIYRLIKNINLSSSLKIRLLDISVDEIRDDLENATEFDQSDLFKKLYEDEYGSPGGEPISCLIFDYYMRKNMQDFYLISQLADTVSAAHIPTIASVDPSMFDIKEFSSLYEPKDLHEVFENIQLAPWHSFRQKDSARYITMVLPKVLQRLPYGENNSIKTFGFKEQIDPNNNSDFCWGNAAYSMAQCIANAFDQYGWVSAIRGVDSGGKVEDLPLHSYTSLSGELSYLCPTEIAITDRREKELSDLGFLPLCYFKKTNYAVFFGGQTAILPTKYSEDSATANSQLSSSLPCLLSASRFVHYMKCMIRDYIGSISSQDDIQMKLQKWLAGYVTLNTAASMEVKARFPLAAAKVQVFEKLGEPGQYYAVVYVKPHFQLESIDISTRLVAELPSKKT